MSDEVAHHHGDNLAKMTTNVEALKESLSNANEGLRHHVDDRHTQLYDDAVCHMTDMPERLRRIEFHIHTVLTPWQTATQNPDNDAYWSGWVSGIQFVYPEGGATLSSASSDSGRGRTPDDTSGNVATSSGPSNMATSLGPSDREMMEVEQRQVNVHERFISSPDF